MKTRWFAMAAVPALAIPLAWSQAKAEGGEGASGGAKGGKLARVAPKSEARDDAAEFDARAWREKLATGDLRERESAFDELVGLARRDPSAREAIERWSRDESDAGLAWTSRLALRELDRTSTAWAFHGGDPHGNLFGKHFDFDDFAQRFDHLDSMFGDLRAQWEGMLQGLPNPSMHGTSKSHSLSLETGPDGVTCKVTETVDGEEKTREYTAGSIDELLEAHPELREKVGGHGPFSWTMPNGSGTIVIPRGRDGQGLFRAVPPSGGRLELGPRAGGGLSGRAAPGAPSETPTDRLGIFCEEVGEDLAEELGIDAGEGLRVTGVQGGTIADRLGLRAGDVVLEINGETIRAAEDVKRVLSERDAAGEVSVVVAGSEGRRTLTWKPSGKKSGGDGSKSPRGL